MRNLAHYLDRQEATKPAPHSREPWTPEDIATALDTAFTAEQAGQVLGRTAAAIANIRTKYRKENQRKRGSNQWSGSDK